MIKRCCLKISGVNQKRRAVSLQYKHILLANKDQVLGFRNKIPHKRKHSVGYRLVFDAIESTAEDV